MNNRFTRFKQFVDRHKTAVAYGAGTFTGVFITSYVVLRYPTPALGPKHLVIKLSQTSEEVFETLKQSGGMSITNPATKQAVHIATKDLIDQM